MENLENLVLESLSKNDVKKIEGILSDEGIEYGTDYTYEKGKGAFKVTDDDMAMEIADALSGTSYSPTIDGDYIIFESANIELESIFEAKNEVKMDLRKLRGNFESEESYQEVFESIDSVSSLEEIELVIEACEYALESCDNLDAIDNLSDSLDMVFETIMSIDEPNEFVNESAQENLTDVLAEIKKSKRASWKKWLKALDGLGMTQEQMIEFVKKCGYAQSRARNLVLDYLDNGEIDGSVPQDGVPIGDITQVVYEAKLSSVVNKVEKFFGKKVKINDNNQYYIEDTGLSFYAQDNKVDYITVDGSNYDNLKQALSKFNVNEAKQPLRSLMDFVNESKNKYDYSKLANEFIEQFFSGDFNSKDSDDELRKFFKSKTIDKRKMSSDDKDLFAETLSDSDFDTISHIVDFLNESKSTDIPKGYKSYAKVFSHNHNFDIYKKGVNNYIINGYEFKLDKTLSVEELLKKLPYLKDYPIHNLDTTKLDKKDLDRIINYKEIASGVYNSVGLNGVSDESLFSNSMKLVY